MPGLLPLLRGLFPEEGDRILDACAAPGGKSFTLAELTNDKAEIISADIYEHKTKLIKDGAKRLRIRSIRTVINNAEVYNEHLGEFDRILCDVPCSGLGIIRKSLKYVTKVIQTLMFCRRYSIIY